MNDDNGNIDKSHSGPNTNQPRETRAPMETEPFVFPQRNRREDVSPRNRSARAARNQNYLDDIALNAMLASGMLESMGPVNFSQFRIPSRQASFFRQLTDPWDSPMVIDNHHNQWKDAATFLVQSQAKGENKRNQIEVELEEEEEGPGDDPRFLITQLTMATEVQDEARKKNIDKKRQESLLEWFDRSVESELKKRKENLTFGVDRNFGREIPVDDLLMTKSMLERMSEASASRIELAQQLAKRPNTDLTDAVDKLAKAEAMCSFAGAVKAAEAAAEAAPPGCAEEAAVASARGFQTEMSTVKEEFEGVKPIEVLGYVGVTKPKHPVHPRR